MDSTAKTIIVTGCNRGIGYELVKQLYLQDTPRTIIMTSRNLSEGQKAYDQIKQASPNMKSTLYLEQLDIADDSSVDTFFSTVQTKYKEHDVLVNNAAIGERNDVFGSEKDPSKTYDVILKTIQVNFLATVKFTEKMLPLLSENGKIIMVSSLLGGLQFQGPQVKKALQNSNITRQELLEYADYYLKSAKENTYKEAGFNPSSHNVSKALLNTYSRFVLRKMVKPTQQIYVCSPGWCRTDMGTEIAPKKAEEGPDTIIYLIDLPFKYDLKLDCQYYEDRTIGEF